MEKATSLFPSQGRMQGSLPGQERASALWTAVHSVGSVPLGLPKSGAQSTCRPQTWGPPVSALQGALPLVLAVLSSANQCVIFPSALIKASWVLVNLSSAGVYPSWPWGFALQFFPPFPEAALLGATAAEQTLRKSDLGVHFQSHTK